MHGKLAPGPEALCEWLADYAKELGNRPVVFPVSDQVVLELARHRERLSALCRIWNNDHDSLNAIVSKDTLYDLASDAGIRTPPGITAPGIGELRQWFDNHSGPYLVKPFYHFNQQFKVLVFDTAGAVMDFIDRRGAFKNTDNLRNAS